MKLNIPFIYGLYNVINTYLRSVELSKFQYNTIDEINSLVNHPIKSICIYTYWNKHRQKHSILSDIKRSKVEVEDGYIGKYIDEILTKDFDVVLVTGWDALAFIIGRYIDYYSDIFIMLHSLGEDRLLVDVPFSHVHDVLFLSSVANDKYKFPTNKDQHDTVEIEFWEKCKEAYSQKFT